MYQYKITEKTDADAIQKAHMLEGVHAGAFIPLDKQLTKAAGGARGGKYTKRVATGNPKRPWRYEYGKTEGGKPSAKEKKETGRHEYDEASVIKDASKTVKEEEASIKESKSLSAEMKESAVAGIKEATAILTAAKMSVREKREKIEKLSDDYATKMMELGKDFGKRNRLADKRMGIYEVYSALGKAMVKDERKATKSQFNSDDLMKAATG